MNEGFTVKVERGNVYINGQLVASECASPSQVSKAIDAWMEQHAPHS